VNTCLDDLRSRGFGLIPALISSHEAAALQRSIAATVRQYTTSQMPRGYVGSLLRFNNEIVKYMIRPQILEMCDQLFGPHWRVSAITGSVNAPGAGGGEFHVDWPHNERDESCIRGECGDRLAHLIAIWMLTDFTESNGGTLVVPGSHRWPLESREGDVPPANEQLLGSAGDVGLLDARLWHAIAPNRSDGDRVAVIVRFAPWWLNLNPLRRGSRDRQLIVEKQSGRDPYVSPLSLAELRALPSEAQPLFDSLVQQTSDAEE
jgi:ectoine hydroxylase-related dioxygenase (phytanoyl-CoA dioxygenase family)